MYVRINDVDYTGVKDLAFAPEVDLTGNSLPANEFTCQLLDAVGIAIGQFAYLYDDRGTLWAKYWIVYAERVADRFVEIKAQSLIARLDRRKMVYGLYQSEPVSDVLADIFSSLPSGTWEADSSISSETISGYVPEQTARERLLWVCFVLGAYVKDFFGDKISIIAIGATQSIIPLEDTYWRPAAKYMEWVTKINVRAYIYTQGQPDVTDSWITDGTPQGYYIETTQDFTLTNSEAPEGVPDNEVNIDDVKLINTSNVSDVLARLALYYFHRAQVDLGCVDNAESMPGQKVYGYLESNKMIQGYIEKATFSFGKQARGDLIIVGVGGDIDVDSARLTILYKYGSMTINKVNYTFPKGHEYRITIPYIDMTLNGHRYVFRPTNEVITGTLLQNTTVTEVMIVAVDFYQADLHIKAADEVIGGEVLKIG